MNRLTIRALSVRETPLSNSALLPPGTLLSECKVVRNAAGGTEPYVVDFESGGRTYTCPLYMFQARTQTVSVEGADAQRSSEPLAV